MKNKYLWVALVSVFAFSSSMTALAQTNCRLLSGADRINCDRMEVKRQTEENKRINDAEKARRREEYNAAHPAPPRAVPVTNSQVSRPVSAVPSAPAQAVRPNPVQHQNSGALAAPAVPVSAVKSTAQPSPKPGPAPGSVAARDATCKSALKLAHSTFADRLSQAEVLAQSAIDRTNCIYAMGVIRENQGKDTEALHYFRIAADKGDPYSMLSIGAIYHVGVNGGSVDLPLAFQWFKKARVAYDTGHYNDEYLSGLIDDNVAAVDPHPPIVEREQVHTYTNHHCQGNKHWSDFFQDCEY
jgi:hypothetical protein